MHKRSLPWRSTASTDFSMNSASDCERARIGRQR
jgi:hypothetical protein